MQLQSDLHFSQSAQLKLKYVKCKVCQNDKFMNRMKQLKNVQ
jgi:hypothetical protein